MPSMSSRQTHDTKLYSNIFYTFNLPQHLKNPKGTEKQSFLEYVRHTNWRTCHSVRSLISYSIFFLLYTFFITWCCGKQVRSFSNIPSLVAMKFQSNSNLWVFLITKKFVTLCLPETTKDVKKWCPCACWQASHLIHTFQNTQ